MESNTELKRIDFNKGSFEANGKTYFINKTLNVERFRIFERLQAHIGFSVNFETLYGKLKEAYEALNKGKVADAAVKLDNVINAVWSRLEDKSIPALEMCTLFLVTEDEDLKSWDKELAKKKIDDWKRDFAMDDFFQLAFNFVNGFIEAYNQHMESISEKEKEMLMKGFGEKQ